MSDGFQVVKSKRRKPKKVFSPCLEIISCVETQEQIQKKLISATIKFETSELCEKLLVGIQESLKALKSSSFNSILCYGLGQFSTTSVSLHQLAALVVIQKNFQSPVKVFDPLFNSTEQQVLKDLQFEVIIENEEGKRSLGSSKKTLVFLPHCPRQLTNNFLWANWSNNLKNIVLINNRFSSIVESNTKKTLLHSANFIDKAVDFTCEINLETPYELPNTFNDLAIHFFNCDSYIFETENPEPIYSEETELITKKLSNILVQENVSRSS